MIEVSDHIARSVRVREAKTRGIRAVPTNPGPEFLFVPYACDLAPYRCHLCTQASCNLTRRM